MLDSRSMTRFVELFHEVIIATDLKVHLLDNRVGLESMCRLDPATKRPQFDWKNEKHRTLLRGLMMTTSDLCVQFKPFPVVQRIVERLMIEFYEQGDKEKALGTKPIPSMDRAQADRIPEIQVQFLRIVVLPCFGQLRIVLPLTEVMYTNSKHLKNTWMEMVKRRKKYIHG